MRLNFEIDKKKGTHPCEKKKKKKRVIAVKMLLKNKNDKEK